MSAVGRVDAFQRRHPTVGIPIAVVYKYLDDQGGYLAALITYYGFVSLFPVLLLLSAALGFALESQPDLQARIMESAFRQIPVISDQVQRSALHGSGTAVAVGAVGALYGALGVAQAMQNAMNSAWYVPRISRPNAVLGRLRSLALLLLVAFFLIVSTLLSQGVLDIFDLGERAMGASGLLISSLITLTLFLIISCHGTTYPVAVRQALPGSLLGVLIWQVLQSVGSSFVRSYIAGASATNGVFAVVLGLLAWSYLVATGFVICAELNAVLALGLHPRALLTPLTDDVDLTDADLDAYAALARAQQIKGFQQVRVSFDHDGQVRSARLRREEYDRLAAEAHEETRNRVAKASRERAARREAERLAKAMRAMYAGHSPSRDGWGPARSMRRLAGWMSTRVTRPRRPR
ncbi:hypothetical protein KEM60_02288 [Austwickia sp. TVS 96-490-7B]|uniref:YihY/virulence factor BrkB family protein n=1 Tax=Austwickia sp. TVS 96-490-7B TaxID=2830843 RepID=UPI001C598E95|nr:YihY/virulence factor BrkB family protein [Austwickia sp. TVS 96-490-7B]MBW3086077.1 hypothetical protein [Austwickia sp. TVS 96-490-7B]